MKIKILALVIIFASYNSISADNIGDILGNISSNNLELKSAEEELKVNSAEIKSNNNLGETDVDFEYLFGEKSLGNRWAIGVSQAFDWPGLYNARSKANKSQISALSYLLMQKKLDILFQAKEIC